MASQLQPIIRSVVKVDCNIRKIGSNKFLITEKNKITKIFHAFMYLCRLSQAVPLLEDEVVLSIAKKHDKTAAQVLLRFLTQLNVAVIPKSSNPNRLKENFDVRYYKIILIAFLS